MWIVEGVKRIFGRVFVGGNEVVGTVSVDEGCRGVVGEVVNMPILNVSFPESHLVVENSEVASRVDLRRPQVVVHKDGRRKPICRSLGTGGKCLVVNDLGGEYPSLITARCILIDEG